MVLQGQWSHKNYHYNAYPGKITKPTSNTYIYILLPDVCDVVRVRAIGVHPLDGVIGTIRIEGVIVVLHPFLHPLIEELLRHLMMIAHQPVVFDYGGNR